MGKELGVMTARAAAERIVERLKLAKLLETLDDGGNVEAIFALKDSPHSGDCTKQPWTCVRCQCDYALAKADAILAAGFRLTTPAEDAVAVAREIVGWWLGQFDPAPQITFTQSESLQQAIAAALTRYGDARAEREREANCKAVCDYCRTRARIKSHDLHYLGGGQAALYRAAAIRGRKP